MNTLIYTSVLGVICMLVEMLNLRKLVIPIAVTGLLVIFGLNITQYGGAAEGLYHNMVVIDKYSTAFSGLLIVLGIFLVLLSHDFYKGEESKISDYIAIIIFTLCGALALVSFGNMAMFFLGLEVLSISLYILAGSRKKDVRSNEAGMKYFLMGSFASGLLLFGIALIYGETKSFDIAAINAYAGATTPSVMFYIGIALIMMALLFKASAAPFHFWAPDVYEGSPMLITAFMSTVAKIAAFAAFYRLFHDAFKDHLSILAWVLSGIAALTMLVGNLSALNQDSFKRLLAFSGISHAGYLMMGIVVLYGNNAANAVFYYSVAYGLVSIAAFAIAMAVAKNAGSEKIDAFNGLGKRKPMLAVALTIAMLSMAGIPPFAGFLGKYYIFSEAVVNHHTWLTVFAVINSVIGVYYYFKVIVAMYVKDSDEVEFKIPPVYGIVIALCVLLTIVAGIAPSWLSGLI